MQFSAKNKTFEKQLLTKPFIYETARYRTLSVRF